MDNDFAFRNIPSLASQDCLVVYIDSDCKTCEELFEVYNKQICFPEYFGGNWDAFLDCLRTMDWISQFHVEIFHQKLPLKVDRELITYLEILQDAVHGWRKYREHSLEVVFPDYLRPEISLLLSGAE